MNIWLNIDYHGDGVLAFAPEKVLARVEQYFPQTEFDAIDYGWQEVDRITEFANKGAFHDGASMINQIRGKYRRNSPSYRFKVVTNDGTEINGHARRYSVRFACEIVFDAVTEKTIIEFMQSLKYGEISSDTKTDNFCVSNETFVNKWTLEK